MLACNPVLNQHLCDTFSAKVLELNDSTFTLTDDDDGVQSSEDNEVQLINVSHGPCTVT